MIRIFLLDSERDEWKFFFITIWRSKKEGKVIIYNYFEIRCKI